MPANRKKGFFTSGLSKTEEIGGIFYLAAQNFKNSKSKLKSIKHMSVDVRSWDYPMAPLLGRSNLSGKQGTVPVPLKIEKY